MMYVKVVRQSLALVISQQTLLITMIKKNNNSNNKWFIEYLLCNQNCDQDSGRYEA